jgi:hypothetical protein
MSEKSRATVAYIDFTDGDRKVFSDVIGSNSSNGWAVLEFADSVIAIPDHSIKMIELVSEEAK